MLNTNITDRMEIYFTSSIQLDVRRLEGIYASDFVSVRTDFNGRCVFLSRDQLLNKVLQLKEQKLSLPYPDKIDLLDISEYGDSCSYFYRMVGEEGQSVHHYVWKRTDDRYFMVRQFAVEYDLTNLLKRSIEK